MREREQEREREEGGERGNHRTSTERVKEEYV